MVSAFQVIVIIKTNSKDVQINHPDWLGLMDLLPLLIRNSLWKKELGLAKINKARKGKESKKLICFIRYDILYLIFS